MVCFNCETGHVYGTHKRNIFCKCLGMVSIHFHEFHQRTDSIALKHITQFVCVYVCVCVWSQYYCLMFSFLFRPEESPTAKTMPTRMFDRKIFAFCFFPCRCYEL